MGKSVPLSFHVCEVMTVCLLLLVIDDVQYLKNVYLTHGFRDLKLHDFNHLAPK